ncbi:transporter substrate-binding domain-containing protein [Ectobacillus ponti]|uniref:Transporter substrate-binding domain-containing protein n=1 Tax=Ectobacillus ponti TaxID=2961894 RepID=A0AA41X6R7_9BACI|nr:transporter substrate-binding domain-containing protein [Ectobacillus ponti]MCP8969974.1 transporter substrate-binding domain-containing protein [Ectobacillus ponti]
MKRSRILPLILMLTAAILLFAACGTTKEAAAPAKDKKPVFTFGMSGLYKPFNYREGGKLAGFDVEIGEALAERMGMTPNPVTNPWETIIQGLQAKKYDAILGSMGITEERKKSVSFSTPYYRSGAQIFVAKDNTGIQTLESLKGKKVGVVKGTTFRALVQPYAGQIVDYDSDITALMDIPTGRLDAVVTDQMVGLRMMKEGNDKIKDAGQPLSTDEIGIAVRKEDKELLEKINKALDEIIKDGTYDTISQKWFGRSILGTKQP